MTRVIQRQPIIPTWLIWIQCAAFVVLYAVWILPGVVGFRNTALVVGALAGLYPIYQYRSQLFQRRALPIWLIVTLFAWASFHLVFLSQDFAAQLREYKRIWKYAAIGAVFAFGLGLSLMSAALNQEKSKKSQRTLYWGMIFLGLCAPVLIYILKYVLTTYGATLGIQLPASFLIGPGNTRYYIPKTDYVAFCLPALAIALGQIQVMIFSDARLRDDFLALLFYVSVIAATLFLFFKQDIKNGMAYAALCISVFALSLLLKPAQRGWWKKWILVSVVLILSVVALYPHVQKNESWRTLVADTKIAFELEKYPQWKYAGEKGYPNNEFGRVVSITNYERAAWFKVGLQLAAQTPLGYGLVEDSFKHMAKNNWPDASPNLSHSHSGWLDVVLAIGIPGFTLIISALLLVATQSKQILEPSRSVVSWGLFATGVLWITTEVSATVTFAALIFWISWAAGLTLKPINASIKSVP